MVSFKEYILEYTKTKEGELFNTVKLRTGLNGKLFDTATTRKHKNTVKKTYKHKDSTVDSLTTGSGMAKAIGGQQLHILLQKYGILFEPNKTKVLGNSKTQIQMYEDEQGNQKGIIKRR